MFNNVYYLFHNLTESPLAVANAKLSELKQTARTSVRCPCAIIERKSFTSGFFSSMYKECNSIELLLTPMHTCTKETKYNTNFWMNFVFNIYAVILTLSSFPLPIIKSSPFALPDT